MVKMQLPEDFRDFFKFLNEAEVEYLLIGGWAVGFHGYHTSRFFYCVTCFNSSNAVPAVACKLARRPFCTALSFGDSD